MKSKPPTKKARLEAAAQQAAALQQNESLLPIADKPNLQRQQAGSSPSSPFVASPLGSYSGASTSKASTSVTASELVAAAKAAAAAALASSSAPSSTVAVLATSPLQPYPIFNLPNDLSVSKECSRINAILNATQNKCGSPGTSDAFKMGTADGGISVQSPLQGTIFNQALSMDDIDGLQTELENLWSTAAVRGRILQNQMTILQNSPTAANVSAVLGDHFDPHHQEKINAVATIIDSGHGTRTSVSAAAKLVMGPHTPTLGSPIPSTSVASPTGLSGRKSNNSQSSNSGVASPLRLDKQPKKKLKGDVEGKGKRGDNPAKIGQRTHSVSSDIGPFDSLCKHEAPNQFWEFADTYCRDITVEDLDDFDRLMQEHRVVPDNLLEIPSLGKHFKDDEETTKIKDRQRKESKPKDICGPLTQRLVAALVEDRVSTYNNQHSNGLRDEGGEGFFINRPGLVRALGLDGGAAGNSATTPALEARLRQVLLEQGLLRSEEANDPLLNGDDEILAEIHRSHNVYRKLHQYNMNKLKELYDQAKVEQERSVLKKELDKVDKEVIEAYRTYVSLRLKKKPPSKKERDTAFAALANRQAVLEKLGD